MHIHIYSQVFHLQHEEREDIGRHNTETHTDINENEWTERKKTNMRGRFSKIKMYWLEKLSSHHYSQRPNEKKK